MTISQFRERIRTALSNEVLQIALDANAERRKNGRLDALASLPDWQDRRQRAHELRAEVITRLDEYLDQFIAQARRNNFIIHHAQDALAATDTVVEIVKNSAGRRTSIGQGEKEKPVHRSSFLVAKSKSMVSEEINLNHALEAEGIEVVETDLGEYIVQLRGERPAHIITPAVHLRRQEVGQLFHEKLGIPYTEDIPTLTNTARKVLREVFLSADVGLTGVNFAVAETGALCIVTNEGNGRMVTTLPSVHIALLGMERLVPRLDDLALFLSLLPRSATGQKLSVYTQLIHAPLPGQQRHIIILDNGRSALRSSPLAEALYCIRCGACLNACPVFREVGGHAYDSVYPGPIGSVISAGLFGSEFASLAQASTLCGACKDACPVDIDLPKMLTRVRAGLSPSLSSKSKMASKPNRGSGLKADIPAAQLQRLSKPQGYGALSARSRLAMQIYGQLAARPRLFAFSQRLAALASNLVAPFDGWIHLPGITGWGYSKDFPKFAFRPFHTRINRQVVKSARVIKTKQENNFIQPPAPAAQESVTERFVKELIAVNGSVTRTNPGDLQSMLISFLESRGVKRIQLEPGILDKSELAKANIESISEPDHQVKYGITKVICGLADTGSILVADGGGTRLTASLLTEVHLAVLQASDILPSLQDALALPVLRASCSAVFITGPSRTGDIEMSHTIGVHGPGELHVFLVDDSFTG